MHPAPSASGFDLVTFLVDDLLADPWAIAKENA